MAAKEQTCLIALGGNMPSPVGEPLNTLQAALTDLAQSGVEIEAVSPFYATPCFPAGAGPDYVNAAARLRTSLRPEVLLVRLHDVEASYGRTRETRWGMRSLDLDLLSYGVVIHPDQETYESWHALPLEAQKLRAPDELILPHPRLAERAFVLVPLADVAGDWKHPVTGQTVTQMLDELPSAEKEAVTPLD